MMEWRIYETEAPISVVFAVQPLNSVEFPLEEKNPCLTASLQASALLSCSQFALHLLRQVSLYFPALGFHMWHFDSWSEKLLDKVSVMNRT